MKEGKQIAIGKLGKPHGISGAFRFLLYRELKNKKKQPAYLMLEVKGNLAPFFIQHIDWQGWGEGRIKFEEIQNPETARQYSGREIFLPEAEAEALFRPDADSLDFLLQYTVVEETLGEIGTVTEVTDNAAQVLLTVKTSEGEKMIPLADDFILKIDKRKKQLLLQLPEGLLDL